ncbi:hypothetical protein L596_014715 [Steinernema carpocapsae]|uniref:Uncharacterized protein n=1 Tax=Steinernema carpocapsae TaxID=34508 RepID=A0A4U5NDW6_STECR|nr:hypothetical protein L596_014715 [Steinernema carpocapsae]
MLVLLLVRLFDVGSLKKESVSQENHAKTNYGVSADVHVVSWGIEALVTGRSGGDTRFSRARTEVQPPFVQNVGLGHLKQPKNDEFLLFGTEKKRRCVK